MQYRHGDLLIERVEEIPAHAQPRREPVLAEGEVTGHAHRVVGNSVAVLEASTGEVYLRVVDAPAEVRHEEHATITLPPGEYVVRRQREWDPYAEAARRVAD